jgi:SAM-dependent methyltransferase
VEKKAKLLQPIAALDQSRYEFAATEACRLKPMLNSVIAFDVGAGQAPMRAPLEGFGYEWNGFDLFPAHEDIQLWDLTEPKSVEKKADLILMMDVLEHLFNPGIAMRHISDALLPGGRIILTVPNPKWSRGRISLLYKGYIDCFSQSDLDLNHHVFTPWPHIVSKLLDDVGLEIEKYVTLEGRTGFPRPNLSLHYPVSVAHALVNKLIEASDPSSCGMSYGFVARRR